MTYLDSSELSSYGLPADTSDAWLAAASAMIEAACRRPSLAAQQYTERLRITPDRNGVQLSFLPLAVVAPATTPFANARARYAMPRRGENFTPLSFPDVATGAPPVEFISDIALAFSLPGTWTNIDITSLDYFSSTGEVTFPSNVLGIPYNEIELTYTAGLDPTTIPAAVKFACAQIIRNAQAMPAFNVRSASLQSMHLEYFQDSLVDASVRALLEPYVARRLA